MSLARAGAPCPPPLLNLEYRFRLSLHLTETRQTSKSGVQGTEGGPQPFLSMSILGASSWNEELCVPIAEATQLEKPQAPLP